MSSGRFLGVGLPNLEQTGTEKITGEEPMMDEIKPVSRRKTTKTITEDNGKKTQRRNTAFRMWEPALNDMDGLKK
jgi:hypothetical protein